MLGRQLRVNRCAYATVEEDQDSFTLTGNYIDGVQSIVGRYTFRQFGEECLRLLRRGEPYVVNDAETDTRVTAAEQPVYQLTAIRSVICVPMLKQGRFVAAMAVHTLAPRAWHPLEVELVQQVASRCWESIERARLTHSLKESEYLFRALANSIANLAWMARPDGWIYWYNDQWYAYTGTTPAEMEGWGWESVHDPAVLASAKGAWQHSIATGTPFEMVFPLRGADGEYRRFLTRVNPVRDSQGRVVHWFGTNTDVEDERRATEANVLARNQVNELREASEAANRAKDEFLAMLGHELRNPLSPIVTALHLMNLRGGNDGAHERRIIERQVAHLTRLVDDLLDVSRIARGKVELKSEIVELHGVVAQAIEMARPLVEQRAHALTVDVPARGLAVKGDVTRLSQVVANLLNNAAKYTPVGGRITITGEVHQGEAVLRVRDTGMGIAADVLTGIFDLFVQGRQTIDRSAGGLGLGLAIAKNLIERHGGSVSAFSDGVGHGSEFVVRLPHVAADEQASAASPRTPVTSEQSCEPQRILVVDDNEDGAEMLSVALGHKGHDTRTAYDAATALKLAEEFVPDLAFLDIGLPEMDGYELATRLRRLPGLEGIYLVALTGYGQESDRRKTRAAGFDQHLVKPVDFSLVDEVVSESRSQAERRPHSTAKS